jgi:hypothetical protein
LRTARPIRKSDLELSDLVIEVKDDTVEMWLRPRRSRFAPPNIRDEEIRDSIKPCFLMKMSLIDF